MNIIISLRFSSAPLLALLFRIGVEAKGFVVQRVSRTFVAQPLLGAHLDDGRLLRPSGPGRLDLLLLLILLLLRRILLLLLGVQLLLGSGRLDEALPPAV